MEVTRKVVENVMFFAPQIFGGGPAQYLGHLPIDTTSDLHVKFG